MFASVIIRGKISEKNEDLGVETILGFETLGCRSTIIAPDGTHMREAWYGKFGTERRNVSFALRSRDGSPSSGGQSPRITITTIEATSLTFGEPDPEMFRPPDGYAIKNVAMQQVPCKQASKPTIAAADSH